MSVHAIILHAAAGFSLGWEIIKTSKDVKKETDRRK
jgi:uncharacterized membrane protein SpoIIM required for sporulation